jgi:hypothetical protein
MNKTKIRARAKKRTPPAPTVQKQPETPEKMAGPSLAASTTMSAMPPPNGKPFAARAADVMTAPEVGPGAAGRARMMRAMQGTMGNTRISRMLRTAVQAKLTVGAPNDVYEQEAGRVADQVMRAPEPHAAAHLISRQPGAAGGAGLCPECKENLQRQVEAEEEQGSGPASLRRAISKVQLCPGCAQTLQRRMDEERTEPVYDRSSSVEASPAQTDDAVRRQPEQDESEATEQVDETGPAQSLVDSLISRQPTARSDEADSRAPEVTSDTDSYLNTTRGGGQPLSASSRTMMEPRFGRDFSGVRVHTDSRAAAAAKGLNAQAFTRGQDIYFGQGRYQPGTPQGLQLLAHELTHTVQQDIEGSSIKKGGVQRAELIEGFTPEEVEEYGGDSTLDEDFSETGLVPTDGNGGTAIRKGGRISREQFLRRVPDPKKGDNVFVTLHFNDIVFVEEAGGADNGWYKITTGKGQQGWAPAVSVAVDPPEPNAELYKVKSGDTAIDLAGRWYGPPGGWKRWWWPGSDDAGDARFYVNALAFANKGRAGMPSPADLTERDAWMKVHVIKDLTIWKPSKQFLQSLKGKVSSGSITKEAWEEVKEVAKLVWDFAVYAAAFISGLVYGAGESIYDLFAGAVELVEMVWEIGKSLITGNFVSDAKDLWDSITSLDVSALAEDFLKKWNADDPWDSGFFRGRVVGYVIMEIVMLVASDGILTAIKWTGKFAKIGELIAKIPKVAKVAEEVGKAAKLPEKAKNFLKVRYAGKLGKAGAKILEGIEKGKVAIEAYLKSAEHLNKRAAAFKKYLARGGKKSKAAYEKLYDTLTRNRLVGHLAEEQFKLFMKGTPKSYWVRVAGKNVLRKVDNVLGNVAREIKSGPLKLTPFIEKQILKDIELIRTKGLKVEWHLLAGGDSKAIAALKKAGIDVIIY